MSKPPKRVRRNPMLWRLKVTRFLEPILGDSRSPVTPVPEPHRTVIEAACEIMLSVPAVYACCIGDKTSCEVYRYEPIDRHGNPPFQIWTRQLPRAVVERGRSFDLKRDYKICDVIETLNLAEFLDGNPKPQSGQGVYVNRVRYKTLRDMKGHVFELGAGPLREESKDGESFRFDRAWILESTEDLIVLGLKGEFFYLAKVDGELSDCEEAAATIAQAASTHIKLAERRALMLEAQRLKAIEDKKAAAILAEQRRLERERQAELDRIAAEKKAAEEAEAARIAAEKAAIKAAQPKRGFLGKKKKKHGSDSDSSSDSSDDEE